MRSSKSKASGKSLAELKRLRQQMTSDSHSASVPVAQAQRRKKPRPPDPGGSPSPSSKTKPDATPVRTSQLSEQDQALLRQAYAQVEPIKSEPRAPMLVRSSIPLILEERRRHAQGQPRQHSSLLSVSDQYTSIQAENNDIQYRNPACGTDVLRSLSKGKWPIQASLDLHGANLEQARERLDSFLSSCLEHNIKCVRVVHGIGYGSKGEPILRHTVRRWLSQLDAVLAYTQCPEHEGGDGAVKVLLRTKLADSATEL